MRFLLATLLTITLSFIAGLYTPWWSIAIVAFLVALLVRQKIGRAFLSAFIALFLLWGGLALFIDIQNQSVLSTKIAGLFPLTFPPILLAVITGLVGAVVAGFAGMSGSSLLPGEKKEAGR